MYQNTDVQSVPQLKELMAHASVVAKKHYNSSKSDAEHLPLVPLADVPYTTANDGTSLAWPNQQNPTVRLTLKQVASCLYSF